MRAVDVIIVGQGLAGTTLAWAIHQRGYTLAVIDRGHHSSPSRIAAGLITPITGQRLAVAWRFPQLFPSAQQFYQHLQRQLDVTFFYPGPMVRLFVDEGERRLFSDRAERYLSDLVRPLDPAWPGVADFHADHGGFVMPTAARLDVAKYLDASRLWLQRRGAFSPGTVDPSSDLRVTPAGVALPRFGLAARWLIWCQGFEPNPFFPALPFNPVKGEMLTIRWSRVWYEVIHKGAWLAPVGEGRAKVGATYDREALDSRPTPAGRAWLKEQLGRLLKGCYEVVDHSAAVRPALIDGRPVLGLHPAYPSLGILNGLGSKGALLAPFCAQVLADSLASGQVDDNEVSLRRWLPG